MATPYIHSTVPVINTDNIRESLAYYRDVLGFSIDFEYGDPPVYGGVNAGSAEIYFTHSPEFVKLMNERSISPDVFIWITDADHFFDLHVKNGAQIVEGISDRPWGARQYVIKERNGYHLKFAQVI